MSAQRPDRVNPAYRALDPMRDSADIAAAQARIVGQEVGGEAAARAAARGTRRAPPGAPGQQIRTDLGAGGGGGGGGALGAAAGGWGGGPPQQGQREQQQPPPPSWGRPGAGRRPGFEATATPAYGVPVYPGHPGGTPAAHPPGYPQRAPLPQRRPAPGYDVPPQPHEVPYDRAPSLPPRRFAPAFGIPPALGPVTRRRSVRPFDPAILEPVPKESVRVWASLVRAFPAYFHGGGLQEAAADFLRSFLSPESEAGRRISVEVKRKEDGSIEMREFADPEITIGTHAQNRLQVAGAAISRRHVRIVHDERGWCLVDQGSSNGTWLRGERVQPGYAYPLKNGEAFSIPGHEVHVRWTDPPPAPKLMNAGCAAIRVEPAKRFFDGIPAHSVVGIVRMEPGGLRAFVEADLPLASLIAARVLGGGAGGAPGQPESQRPLAEVERGALELVLVKLLDAVARRWGEGAELTFHLERLLDGRDPHVVEAAAGLRQLVVATIALDFDSRRDAARIALPDASLAALRPRFERLVAPAGEHSIELVERYRDLAGLARVALGGVVGRTMLTRAELRACAPGDVFVPDELTIRIEGGEIEGKVELRVAGGRGRSRIEGRLAEYGPEGARVEVAAIHVAPHGRSEASKVTHEDEVEYEGEGMEEAPVAGTAGHPRSDGEAGAAGRGGLSAEELAAAAGLDAEGAGAALLDDVPLPLVIELGRVSLTVRELAAMRRGQVLEMGHDPQQPVSLVFEGHVIGAGKLVNVEGEIGVQITSLGR